jgi:ubiquinone/menaquinone biosynthesis C-methylase UbiE
MPSIEWNQSEWGAAYPWPAQGGEWSTVWGGVETHWYATILPRIRKFLPTGTVLEIAPGYGRWTGYLLSTCDRYFGVDLAEACVTACKQRYSTATHATFFSNDGKSLPMIADSSVDFVFSFDSLVHVEADVIDAYMLELSRVLAPEGIGFIHHSNLGAHLGALTLARTLELCVKPVPPARKVLTRLRVVHWDHFRAKSMTAARFTQACRKAGLVCVGQEIIDWGHIGRKMIDCLSLVTRTGSRWDRPNVVVSNPNFMSEAFSAGRIASVYGSLGTEMGQAAEIADERPVTRRRQSS